MKKKPIRTSKVLISVDQTSVETAITGVAVVVALLIVNSKVVIIQQTKRLQILRNRIRAQMKPKVQITSRTAVETIVGVAVDVTVTSNRMLKVLMLR